LKLVAVTHKDEENTLEFEEDFEDTEASSSSLSVLI
jgi:hypothetical protein